MPIREIVLHKQDRYFFKYLIHLCRLLLISLVNNFEKNPIKQNGKNAWDIFVAVIFCPRV